jgi:hypothetical protein
MNPLTRNQLFLPQNAIKLTNSNVEFQKFSSRGLTQTIRLKGRGREWKKRREERKMGERERRGG